MKKKALSLVLALVMCLGLLPMTALAANNDPALIDGCLIENGVLTRYVGDGGNVTIPAGVTAIKNSAFLNCTSLTSVTIPSGVTKIGGSAFSGCKNLTSVTIPSSVTEIGASAFSECASLVSAAIPSGVAKIGKHTFYNCTSLTSVTILFGVTEIGERAFDGCASLASVTIPSSVTRIGLRAFDGCKGLSSLNIQPGVTKIGVYVFHSCKSLTSVTIPSSITRIENNAFSNCTSLTSVVIEPGVTAIGSSAFEGCTSLASVTIPSTVTLIEDSKLITAFEGCTGLTDVYYGGTEAQWYANKLDRKNVLKDATVHFNSTGSSSTTPVQPQQPDGKTETAMPTNDKLTVDGKLADPTVYKIGGANYFKVRDVAALLNGTGKQFDVSYDNALKSVTVTTEKGYDKQATDLLGAPSGGNQTATPSNDAIYINGQKTELTVYKINGGNYFKLRDLGQALDFYVGWEQGTGMFIETDKGYTA